MGAQRRKKYSKTHFRGTAGRGIENMGERSVKTPYSEEYKEKCFYAWYSAGRPVGQTLLANIPEDAHGRKATTIKIHEWRKFRNWELRADELDAQVSLEVEKLAVREKVEMFQEHTEISQQLRQLGLEYFLDEDGNLDPKKIDSSNVALRLIVQGIRIERESRGIADAIKQVAKLSDGKLMGTISALMDGMTPEEAAELEEIVEGDFADVNEAEAAE